MAETFQMLNMQVQVHVRLDLV